MFGFVFHHWSCAMKFVQPVQPVVNLNQGNLSNSAGIQTCRAKSYGHEVGVSKGIRVNVCSQNCGDFFSYTNFHYVSIGSTHLSSTHLGQFRLI